MIVATVVAGVAVRPGQAKPSQHQVVGYLPFAVLQQRHAGGFGPSASKWMWHVGGQSASGWTYGCVHVQRGRDQEGTRHETQVQARYPRGRGVPQ